MRLKSFYAKTMTEAMQMVRETLGENAIIVATREEQGGRAVRVTAAIDRADEGPNFEIDPAAVSTSARPPRGTGRQGRAIPEHYLQYDAEETEEDAVNEILTDTVLRHGIPSDIADTILSTAMMMGMGEAGYALKAALEHAFSYAPLPLKSRRALMMIGAPGAGKTLATAKLAARAAMTDLRPAVITTDTVRAGGVEQLEAFTRLLQIPLHKARNAAELRARLETVRGADLIVIDTGGCNPFDVDDMRAQAALLEAGTIEPVLVMAAGGDAEESAETARCFSVLGAQRLFPTRLDIARRMGGLVAAAGRAGLSFSDASNTPMVAGGLITLSAQSLANLLLPSGARGKSASRGAAGPAPKKLTPSNARGAAQATAAKNTRRTG